MNRLNKTEEYPIRIKPYALVLALIWSAIVTASLLWNVYQAKQGTLDVARIQARNSFMKDVIYRRWNAGHGGVYVPVTDKTPPNLYLKVPERDITTLSGTVLTYVIIGSWFALGGWIGRDWFWYSSPKQTDC